MRLHDRIGVARACAVNIQVIRSSILEYDADSSDRPREIIP